MKVSWHACLLGGLLSSGAALAQVDAAVGGTVPQANFASRYALSTANPANLAFTTDPLASGRPALLVKVKSSEGAAGAIKRTDFYPLNESRSTGIRWYAMSVYFPTNWAVHPNPTVVAQVDTAAAPSSLAAPLSFVVRGSRIELNLNSNHRAATGSDPATAANSSTSVIQLGPMKTAQWYCMVIKSDWSPALGSGAVTIWMNGAKVFDAANSTNSYTSATNVPKVGLLFPGLMGVAERSMYTDFIRLGGPTTNIYQMYAVTPCATTAVIQK